MCTGRGIWGVQRGWKELVKGVHARVDVYVLLVWPHVREE